MPHLRLLTAGFFLLAPVLPAVAEPLVLERTIPLPDVSGRIDHMAADPVHNRLFVAELGNGTVDVVDVSRGVVIKRMEGLKEPQGVAYSAVVDRIAVANAADGSVHLWRGADLAPTGVVQLGDDADNIRLDRGGSHMLVGYGSGGLAVIDPVAATVTTRISLAAHPEGFQISPDDMRAFVNVPNAREVAVVDLAGKRQMARWTVPKFGANFPMAINTAGTTIAVVYRSPPRLVLLSTDAGLETFGAPTCGDADDVFFDEKRNRIYISCGDAHVDVWERDAAGVRHLASIPTAAGARTSLFVPALDRLFVAARAGLLGITSNARLLVMKPVD